MKRTYALSADCYIIPYPEKGKHSYIAYFPIQSLAFEINEDAAKILKSLKTKPYHTDDPSVKEFLEHLESLRVINQSKEAQPFIPYSENPEPTRTILLLSEKCNLKCLYCYNNAQSTGVMMPIRMARDTIDTIIRNAVTQKIGSIELGFHGGGEPTMNWSVLTGSFYYASEICRKEGIQLNSSICTNGIMSAEKAQWIVENINDIAVSADGTPEIQNKQRPFQNGGESFNKVASTLDIFNSHRKFYAIRLTATEYSEGKLIQVIRFLIDRFHPPIICIEPLFVCGRCETSGCKPPDDDHFIEEMIEAYKLGRENKISVQYSGNRMSLLLSRFCGAQGSNFFITPRGDVTACLEVSSREDPRADFFMYGNYDRATRRFLFDKYRFKRLTENQVQSFDSCSDCFAKWHCGGDCLAKTPDFSKVTVQRNAYRCKINKALTRDSLIRTMNEQIEFSKSVVAGL
ncbi:MAG: radical SAM protein [Bacteroidia bacterium]|nr:radical SAM protein [Bacteroidia bacterium]